LLNDVELKILEDIYDMNINNGPRVNINNYDLNKNKRWKEFYYHLAKLKKLNLVKFDSKAIVNGGHLDREYNNNCQMVFTEELEIQKDGIEFINRERETIKDKIKNEAKDFGTVIYKEAKKSAAKTIVKYFSIGIGLLILIYLLKIF
jgi:hypothetical protein